MWKESEKALLNPEKFSARAHGELWVCSHFIIIVVSLVLSRVDGLRRDVRHLPVCRVSCLSASNRLQHTAARPIFGASRQVHVTPLLRSLHWLRVPERIAFRLAVLVYRCLNGTAPAYLSADLLCVSEVDPRQRLRSATTSALVGRRTQRFTIGDHAFAAAAPAVWNSLPEDVRLSTSLQLFRRRLKSELFWRTLGPRHSTQLYLAVM